MHWKVYYPGHISNQEVPFLLRSGHLLHRCRLRWIHDMSNQLTTCGQPVVPDCGKMPRFESIYPIYPSLILVGRVSDVSVSVLDSSSPPLSRTKSILDTNGIFESHFYFFSYANIVCLADESYAGLKDLLLTSFLLEGILWIQDNDNQHSSYRDNTVLITPVRSYDYS